MLAPFVEAEKGSTPTAFTGAWADFQNGVANVVVQSQPDPGEEHLRRGQDQVPARPGQLQGPVEPGPSQQVSTATTIPPAAPVPAPRAARPPRERPVGGRPLWLMSPTLVLLLVVIVVPFLISIVISFLDLDQYTLRSWYTAPFIAIDNYIEAFKTAGLRHSIWISLAFSLLTTSVCAPLGLLAALAVNTTFRGAAWSAPRSSSPT